MFKRFLFTTGVILVGVLGTSCVSPFYGTARIVPGWHIDAGIAGMSEITPSFDSWGFEHHYGIRADSEIRYGFNPFAQLNGRVALGGAPAWPPVFADVAIGGQIAYPLGPIAPALRAEISWYGGGPTFSPAFLLGFGRTEWLTLGVRTHIPGNLGDSPHPEYGPYLDPYPIDMFVSFHIGRVNLFAGSQVFRYSYNEDPVFSIGIGYNIK